MASRLTLWYVMVNLLCEGIQGEGEGEREWEGGGGRGREGVGGGEREWEKGRGERGSIYCVKLCRGRGRGKLERGGGGVGRGVAPACYCVPLTREQVSDVDPCFRSSNWNLG